MDVWGGDKDILYVDGQGGGWLMTEKEYSDFDVQLEFKMPKVGNSGVALRVPLMGDPAYDGHGNSAPRRRKLQRPEADATHRLHLRRGAPAKSRHQGRSANGKDRDHRQGPANHHRSCNGEKIGGRQPGRLQGTPRPTPTRSCVPIPACCGRPATWACKATTVASSSAICLSSRCGISVAAMVGCA